MLFAKALSCTFQFFLSHTIFSLRPLPRLVRWVEPSEVMMRCWLLHLKCDSQILFNAQYSSLTVETEWLISSSTFLWLSLPWFLGASKILTSLFSQHPCPDVVRIRLERAFKSLETNCNKLEGDLVRDNGWVQRKGRHKQVIGIQDTLSRCTLCGLEGLGEVLIAIGWKMRVCTTALFVKT